MGALGQAAIKPPPHPAKRPLNLAMGILLVRGRIQATGAGSGASSGSSNNASTSSSSSGASTTQQTPPTTVKAALQDTANALHTRVPVILPNTLPISSGHYATATTKSETWYYRVHFYETAHPTKINAATASNGTSLATFEGTEYTDSKTAKSNIDNYIKASQTPPEQVDLGYGIKASVEGATGHSYLHWNEGRWSITIDSPTDHSFEKENGTDLGKQVAAYLNKAYLPAPKSIGAILIHNWKHSHETTVEWQFNQMTYKITSQTPMMALKIAVASH